MVDKTVLIFDQCGQAAIEFYAVEGDLTRLDGVFINSVENVKLQKELNKLMYDNKGQRRMKARKKFPIKAVKNGAAVVVCGFYP